MLEARAPSQRDTQPRGIDPWGEAVTVCVLPMGNRTQEPPRAGHEASPFPLQVWGSHQVGWHLETPRVSWQHLQWGARLRGGCWKRKCFSQRNWATHCLQGWWKARAEQSYRNSWMRLRTPDSPMTGGEDAAQCSVPEPSKPHHEEPSPPQPRLPATHLPRHQHAPKPGCLGMPAQHQHRGSVPAMSQLPQWDGGSAASWGCLGWLMGQGLAAGPLHGGSQWRPWLDWLDPNNPAISSRPL